MYQRRPPSSPLAPIAAPAVDPWDAPAIATEEPGVTGQGDATALLPWIDDALAFAGSSLSGEETPQSHHEAGPRQVAEAPPSKRPAGAPSDWHTIAQRPILEHWATPTVELPPDVVRGLDEAYGASERDGFEHGGNIVRKRDQYSMRAAGDGTPGSFDPDEKDTGGKTLVGAYHTHPKDTTTGQYSGFSGEDIANMTMENRNVSLLRSGESTRMLARTKEFEDRLRNADSPDELADEMSEEYEKAYTAVLGGDPRNHYRAIESATQYTARKYHLLYYSGKGAKLDRVGGRPR